MSMPNRVRLAGPVAALVAASLAAPAARGQTLNDSRLRLETWATGLNQPTTFTWIGPNEMFIFEKTTGKVKRIKDGSVKKSVLDLNVSNDSERGGLGIAADPDFANNGFVYVYYSATSAGRDGAGSWADNRVERYTWDGTNLVNGTGPLISFAMDNGQGGNGPNHDGGVIRFGPDGKLYGVTGDLNRGRFGGGNERIEQNTATTGSARVGGVFRINSDGTIPTDNPFVGESDANLHLWYSYGLRNSFGMTWDPLNATLWYTENGPDKYDEIDRCPKGMNSGWLKIMGPDSRNATYGENGNTNFDASQLTMLTNAIYVDPEFSYKATIGITAIEFIHSKRFPADLRDDVLAGDNNTGNLYFFKMKAGRQEFDLNGGIADKVADSSSEVNKTVFGKSFSVLTDIQVGADGYIYLVNLGTGIVHRIRPVTDLVEPATFVPVLGTITHGKLDNLEESDDTYVHLEVTGPTGVDETLRADASYVLNATNPTSVTLDVETRVNRANVSEAVLLHNQVTGAWDTLESRRSSRSDTLRTLTVANPADYIRAADRTIELRLAFHQMSGQPPMPNSDIQAWIDQLRMNVTYP